MTVYADPVTILSAHLAMGRKPILVLTVQQPDKQTRVVDVPVRVTRAVPPQASETRRKAKP